MKKTILCFSLGSLFLTASSQSSSLVISQLYGGAGCTTAGCSVYKNDYIEIFNRGSASVSLNGLSVQYASATSTAWQVTALSNVTLQPGQYYLVRQAGNANGINDLPAADVTGSINMNATSGKVALVNGTTALSSCAAVNIIDLVGYGSSASCFEGSAAAPAPSTVNALFRGANGCTETNANNTDFTATAAAPRNMATTLAACAAAPLPVVLREFRGSYHKKSGQVVLSWSTVSEQHTWAFEVERSEDGTRFTKIGSLRAAGNSVAERTYRFTDVPPLSMLLYYRLRIIDTDNNITYSTAIRIKTNGSGKWAVYPNPASDIIYIPFAGASSLQIQDAMGRVVKTVLLQQSGGSITSIDISNLSKGIYYIKAGEGCAVFIKQ